MDKYLLIAKPCQSGKTSIVINNIKNLNDMFNIDFDINSISIIFTDNSLLQVDQLKKRIEEENLDIVVLSSKSDVNDIFKLFWKITDEKVKIIICCANTKQIDNINNLFWKLKKNKFNYNFHIFIDEVDKTFTSNYNMNILKKWENNKRIRKITVITATPDKFLKKIDDKIPIMTLENSYNKDTYHKLEDSQIVYISYSDLYSYYGDDNDDVDYGYYDYIIKNHNFSSNTVLYIPSNDVKKKSHLKIANLCTENGFNVLVINSDGNNIYYSGIEEPLLIDKNLLYDENYNKLELSSWLPKIFKEYNLENNKFAITGHLSIGRGITISSPKLMITDAIIPDKIIDKSNLYQLAGRICGNSKKWDNYKPIRVFAIKQILDIVINEQNKIINYVENAYKYGHETICHNSLNLKDDGNKYGIPIKITYYNYKKFFKKYKELKGDRHQLLKPDIRKLNRILKNHITKKLCEVENKNEDYDINDINIRNFKIIKLKEEEKIKKYPIDNINNKFIFNKRCKTEEKNTNEINDAILYMVCFDNKENNIFKTNVNIGDIFITFIKHQ
jgi:hypothetical protein